MRGLCICDKGSVGSKIVKICIYETNNLNIEKGYVLNHEHGLFPLPILAIPAPIKRWRSHAGLDSVFHVQTIKRERGKWKSLVIPFAFLEKKWKTIENSIFVHSWRHLQNQPLVLDSMLFSCALMKSLVCCLTSSDQLLISPPCMSHLPMKEDSYEPSYRAYICIWTDQYLDQITVIGKKIMLHRERVGRK